MKTTRLLVLSLVGACVAPAFALSETFPDPLGSYWGRWLYQNSNLGSYYYATGEPDPDYRGNNPEGLWAVDTQELGGGVGGPTMDIIFDPGFGATLTSLAFGGEYFAECRVTIYDMDNNVLATSVFSGGGFEFNHTDIISANSGNGISHILFDSQEFGGGQIEGNTSVDNFEAEVVPEPASLIVLAAGLAFLAKRRR
ncbi:MAG: PEP-CTERM sorting domain-containing protein [Fimbriimonadales bacterium]